MLQRKTLRVRQLRPSFTGHFYNPCNNSRLRASKGSLALPRLLWTLILFITLHQSSAAGQPKLLGSSFAIFCPLPSVALNSAEYLLRPTVDPPFGSTLATVSFSGSTIAQYIFLFLEDLLCLGYTLCTEEQNLNGGN